MAELINKRIVVTGAAKGIGKSIAQELVARGARVAALDLFAPDFEGVDGYACDVTRERDVVSTIETVAADFGGIDALVNNAGVVLEKPLIETSLDEFEHVIAVNLRGVFLVGREVVKHFNTDQPDDARPRIVNIASELAHLGREDYSVYCASKGGVISLTRSWARELAPHIQVNALAPGPTDTDMLKSEKNYDAWVKTADGVPLGRVGNAQDIARAAAFLCGPDSRFMTGSIIDVNGGAAMY